MQSKAGPKKIILPAILMLKQLIAPLPQLPGPKQARGPHPAEGSSQANQPFASEAGERLAALCRPGEVSVGGHGCNSEKQIPKVNWGINLKSVLARDPFGTVMPPCCLWTANNPNVTRQSLTSWLLLPFLRMTASAFRPCVSQGNKGHGHWLCIAPESGREQRWF